MNVNVRSKDVVNARVVWTTDDGRHFAIAWRDFDQAPRYPVLNRFVLQFTKLLNGKVLSISTIDLEKPLGS